MIWTARCCIRFTLLPTSAGPDADEFKPQLNIDGDVTDGTPFALDAAGGIAADHAPRPSGGDAAHVGGLGSGLGSGLDGALGGDAARSVSAPAPGGSTLDRLYFEVELQGPHLAAAHSRRILFDRRADAATGDSKSRRALLIQIWAFVIFATTPSCNLAQCRRAAAMASLPFAIVDGVAESRDVLGQPATTQRVPEG
jgi:hypothetical protein